MSKKEKKVRTLSFVQVLAGAGSAVTAAYVGTKLGVSGTVVGAAVGSVSGTVALHLYANSINQGKEALKKAQEITRLQNLKSRKRVPSTATVSIGDKETTVPVRGEDGEEPAHDTVILSDSVVEDISQELAELQRSVKQPWYKGTALKHIVASATVSLLVALGILYFSGMLDKEASVDELQGGVSINTIVVETEEPAPEPTIIYMTPEPTATLSEAPDSDHTQPASPKDPEVLPGSEEPKPVVTPKTPQEPSKPDNVKPTPKPTPKPPKQPSSTPKPTPKPTKPTPEPTPEHSSPETPEEEADIFESSTE